MKNKKNRNYILFFHDILNSIDKIKRYTNKLTYNEFISSEIIIDAVFRNFEVMGEAEKNIRNI